MADPQFDLGGGGLNFVNGEGGGREKTQNVTTVEYNLFSALFGPLCYKVIMFIMNRERGMMKFSGLDI